MDCANVTFKKEYVMKKIVVGMTAAAALAATTFAPVPAKADPISALWLLPAFVGGLLVAGAWHHPAHASYYGAPRAAYYGPYGAPHAAAYAQPRAQVYYQQPRAQVRARY